MLGDLLRLRLKALSTDEELAAFAEGFATTITERTRGVVKGSVPLEYLRASRVVAVVDGQGRQLAGYVVGWKQPLRLLDFVPEDARRTLPPPPGASWDDCCEITCLWRRPEVSPAFMGARVWPRAIREAIATGKPYLLGGNQNAKLDNLYVDPTRVTLYVGPSAIGLPSRLASFETRGLMGRAARIIVVETLKRLVGLGKK